MLGGSLRKPWKNQEMCRGFKYLLIFSSWWLNQPICWKICSSNRKSSPCFGVKMKKIGNHQHCLRWEGISERVSFFKNGSCLGFRWWYPGIHLQKKKHVRPEAKSVRVCFAVRCIELFFDSGSCGVPLWNFGLAPIYKGIYRGYNMFIMFTNWYVRVHWEKMMDRNTAH